MSYRANHSDPYTVLGIEQDASIQEIKKAHRQKLIEVQYSVTISREYVEAAYLILIDPDERRRLDMNLNAAAVNNECSTEDTAIEVTSDPHPTDRPRQRRMELLAVFLLVVFTFNLYFFVLRQGGEICPQCQRKSIVETARTESSVTLSCTRESCGFTFAYDQAVDLAQDPDED